MAVVLFMMPLAPLDTNTGPVVSPDQKCQVAPHIYHLDLRNAFVPFTMLSASCDAGTGAKGII